MLLLGDFDFFLPLCSLLFAREHLKVVWVSFEDVGIILQVVHSWLVLFLLWLVLRLGRPLVDLAHDAGAELPRCEVDVDILVVKVPGFEPILILGNNSNDLGLSGEALVVVLGLAPGHLLGQACKDGHVDVL